MHIFHPDPTKKRRRMLREAELTLIDTEAALDHYGAQRVALKERIYRLRTELGFPEMTK